MGEEGLRQEEKVLAAVAHGSILLGLFTNGIGGVVVALVIWLVQKEKSRYVAGQALQALVYQAATTLVTMLAWCCWAVLWVAIFLPPIISHPGLYQNTVPPGFWVGFGFIFFPLVLWAIIIVYGLWGAVRCLGGHDFQYAIVGRWLASQRSEP
jgi:uncharacterized Tic20 family protein